MNDVKQNLYDHMGCFCFSLSNRVNISVDFYSINTWLLSTLRNSSNENELFVSFFSSKPFSSYLKLFLKTSQSEKNIINDYLTTIVKILPSFKKRPALTVQSRKKLLLLCANTVQSFGVSKFLPFTFQNIENQ